MIRRWLNLLSIEWLKAKSFYAFGLSIAIQLVVFVVLLVVAANINLNVEGVSTRPFFEFPNIWSSFSWLLSWISLFTGFAVLVIVGAEFGERTYHFQLANGLKRVELLGAKVLFVAGLSIFWALVLFVVALLFGISFSPSISTQDLLQGMLVSFFLFLHTFFLLVIALLISFLVRNTALSILAFVAVIPFEAIIRAIMPEAARTFFPLKALQNLAPMPDFFGLAVMNNPGLVALKSSVTNATDPLVSMKITIAVALIYSLICIAIILFFIRKRSF